MGIAAEESFDVVLEGLGKVSQAGTGAQVGEGEVDENVLTAVVFDRIPVLTIGGPEDDLEGAAEGSELGLEGLEFLGFGVEGEASAIGDEVH